MKNNNLKTKCCNAATQCRGKVKALKILDIEFLYLDLSVCTRCQASENNLEEALAEVAAVLKAAGYKVRLRKVNVNSRELAEKYKFISSPTIRINGRDVALTLKETACKECGDLCGDDVNCRVWFYEGKEYTEPPKAMLVNAILTEVYAPSLSASVYEQKYIVPKNLEDFFSGMQNEK
jgi:hypothetical protein